jgi:hypothetical protein
MKQQHQQRRWWWARQRRRRSVVGIGGAIVVVVAAALLAAASAAEAPNYAQDVVLDALLNLADGLYNHQNLSAVDSWCDPDVVVHGDGLWLPRVDFAGARWLRSIHREYFAAYSDWSCETVAAALGTPTSVAVSSSPSSPDKTNAPKYVSAFALFRWQATNTAAWRGVGPTLRKSEAWGVIEAVLWAPGSKQAAAGGLGAVAALTLRDSGLLEVREASLQRPEPALPLSANITTTGGGGPVFSLADELRSSPEWMPSASLRQGAVARLASVLASLAVGGGGGSSGAARMAAVAGAMAGAATDDVVLADGTDVWGPRAPPEQGKGAVAAWLALWAEQRGVERAEVAASAATSTSNKVFVSFRLAVPPADDDDDEDYQGRRYRHHSLSWPSRPSYIDGVAVGVFDQSGRISRIVLFRNGSPSETREALIGGGGWSRKEAAAVVAVDRRR